MSMALRHQVVWEKCAVTKPHTDEEVILKRGDLLPEWVSDFTKFALTGCGAVKALEQIDPALTVATPEPVYLQEHQLPPVVSAATGQDLRPVPVTSPTAGPAQPAKPAPNANKAEWVAYAVAQRDEGVSEEDARVEAEAVKKDDLVAKYGNGS